MAVKRGRLTYQQLLDEQEQRRAGLNETTTSFLNEIESAYESSDAFKRSGGKKLLVTSGLRNPKSETGNSYKTSKHNDGRAFDLRVNKEFYKWALNTEEGLEIMSKYNFRPLDETDPTTKEKTGATGDHIHFDNDERYNDWI